MSQKQLIEMFTTEERTDKLDPKDSCKGFTTSGRVVFSVLICDFAMTVHCLNCVMNRNS